MERGGGDPDSIRYRLIRAPDSKAPGPVSSSDEVDGDSHGEALNEALVELRQLRAFVAVATDGHFGRAAARLNLTQPGLSLRIRALEKELGAQLLVRSAREVHLTAAGTALLPHARSLLRIEDRALRDLKVQAAGIAGRLRISYLLPGVVAFPGKVTAEFRRRHPTMHVETTAGHSALNVERLREGTVDAAFVHPGFVDLPEGIAVRLLCRDRIVLALPPSHHLARLERVPVKALRREPLITFPSSSYRDFSATLERWLAGQIGTEPNIVAHEPPDNALEAIAHSTSMITFANGARAESAPVPGNAYRRLSPEPLIDFGLAYFRDDESTVLANLLRLIEEMAEGEPGEVPEDSELLVGEPGTPGTLSEGRQRVAAPTLGSLGHTAHEG
jgi:DNA-binding transcriptional LysR family regulator